MTKRSTRGRGLCTGAELAARLEAHPRTVRKWRALGLPVARLGTGSSPSYYDEAAARAWVTAYSERLRGEREQWSAFRARRDAALASESEQRVALRAGRLVLIDEVDRVWSAQVAAVRARLLSWPTALSDRVHRASATEGARGVRAVLRVAVHDALRELHPPDTTRGTTRARRKRGQR